jgi:hypothetical protein
MLDIKERRRVYLGAENPAELIEYIKLSYNGETTYIDPNKVFIFKDFTPSMHSSIIPESRVKVLEMPVNNIIGALESKNVLINYRGALGIITPDPGSGQYVPMALTEKQKQELQTDFMRYGLRNQQWKFIISPAAMKWQQIGVGTKDLLLGEEIVEQTQAICDVYGYPPHLLGIIDPTFNNQAAAEKGLYQNTIIPEAESMDEEWNAFFRTADYNLFMKDDFQHLTVLQEDKVEAARALLTANQAHVIEFEYNIITLDQWAERIGREPVGGEIGNKRYYELIAMGITFGKAKPVTNGDEEQQNGNNNNNSGKK